MNLHISSAFNRFVFSCALVLAALAACTCAIDGDLGDPEAGNTIQSKNIGTAVLKPEEVQSLVAPVALFPDQLLAQVLAASTYPLEMVEAKQWLDRNSNLQGKDLVAAAAKEDWDASVQAIVAFPDVLDRMTENVRWTTDLGNAFLAQQKDVMDAVQRLRLEAKRAGKLKSTREQDVRAKVVEEKTVVEIVPADPEVIYVPVYSPRVVWGVPTAYDYPPLWYPPQPSSADVWIGFGAGVAMGALFSGWDDWCYSGWGWGWPGWGWGGSWGWGRGWYGGGWGWGCSWGSYSNVYVNNYFCNRYGYYGGGRGRGCGPDGGWRHDPYHRGGTPYRNQDVARRYPSDTGRSAHARNAGRGYGPAGGRGGGQGEAGGRSQGRGPDVSLGSGAGGRGGSQGHSRGEVGPAASSGGRASYDRSSISESRGTGGGRSQAAGRSAPSRSTPYAGRASGSARSYGGGSSYSSRGTGSGRSVSVGGSTYGSRSSGGSGSSYGSRSLYGSGTSDRAYSYSGTRGSSGSGYSSGGRGSYSGRSPHAGGGSYGSGQSFGGRSYGGSGGRSYSSGGYGGRSFSGRGYSGGRSFSGGGYRGGGSPGGRSFSGGGSRGGGFSGSGSGGRSSSGGGSRGGRGR